MSEFDALEAIAKDYTALSKEVLEAIKAPKTMKEVPDAPLKFSNMSSVLGTYTYNCKNGFTIKADISARRDGIVYFLIRFSVRDPGSLFGTRGLSFDECKELLKEDNNMITDASEGEVEYYMNLINKLPKREGINVSTIHFSGESLHGQYFWGGRTNQYFSSLTGAGTWG